MLKSKFPVILITAIILCSHLSSAKTIIDCGAEKNLVPVQNVKLSREAQSGKYSYESDNSKAVKISKTFRIYPEKYYQLSAWLKTKASKYSKAYMAILPFDKSGKLISYAAGRGILIVTQTELAAPAKAGDNQILVKNASYWHRGKSYFAQFGAEQDQNDLPNYNISEGNVEKVELTGENFKITLARALAKNYPAGTKIRETQKGPAYIYLKKGPLSNEWIHWQGQIFKGSRICAGIYKAMPVLLCNRNSQPGSSTLIDNFKIEELSSLNLLKQNTGPAGKAAVRLGGKTLSAETHAIVIPDKAAVGEKTAADELRNHLEIITGERLAVITDSELKNKIPITIGKSRLPADFKIKTNFEKLGLEGIHIVVTPEITVLAGGKRGCLYAVFTFLQKYLNCHWFAPDCIVIPKKGNFSLDNIDYTFVPVLSLRSIGYPERRIPEFSVRNKLNGYGSRTPEEWGGRFIYAGKKGFSHTFERLLPPEIYYGKHPEYYSQNLSKKIKPDDLQLCTSNPDVEKILVENARQWIDGTPHVNAITISQNDRGNYCRCEKCMAAARKTGAQSGPLLQLINKIAESLRKYYPDLEIDTLAYGYTWRAPENIKPAENAVIRLCPIQACYSHGFDECDYNKDFVRNFIKWTKISKNSRVWLYGHNCYLPQVPYPNLYSFKKWVNFLIKHNIKGIFVECMDWYMQNCEMSKLRCYLMARILWDPHTDTQTIINEFTDAYYGAAAKPIREYIKLIQNQVTPDTHITISAQPETFLTQKILLKAEGLFQEALDAVKNDPVRLWRVQIARMPVLYCRLHLNELQRKLVGNNLVPIENNAEKLLEEFAWVAGKSDARAKRKVELKDSVAEIRKNLPNPTEAVILKNRKLQIVVVPEHGGRIYSITELKTGRKLLKSTACWKGGYEEFSGKDYKSFGWQNKYKVVRKSDLSVVLEFKNEDGLVFRRTVKLSPDTAEYSIDSQITNASAKTRQLQWTQRTTWNLPDQENSYLWYKTATGKWRQHPLACPDDPRFGRDVTLDKHRLPVEWAFYDSADNYAVLCSFEKPEPSSARFFWKGSHKWLAMETNRSLNLLSGKSISLNATYKLINNNYPWK